MRRRLCTGTLRVADAGRVRTAVFVFATGVSVAAGAAPAGAKPYGRGEDLLLRIDPTFEDPLFLVQWVFYVLALFVGGWAVFRFKTHFEAPQPGGLVTPAVGIAFAIALATVPMLIEALVEGPPPGYRPPVWRGGYAPIPDDVPHRPGPRLGDLLGMPAWVFYALAALVGSGAILSFMAEAGKPERDGLPMQAVGILLALALLAAPTLIGAFVEDVSLEYRPAWPWRDS